MHKSGKKTIQKSIIGPLPFYGRHYLSLFITDKEKAMNTIDVLLIYPPYSYPKKSPPLGLAYIASVLEKKGYSVKIVDMSVLNMDFGDLRKEINNIKPKVTGISFMTNQYKEAVNVSKVVKDIDKHIPVIVGGPHVSALPKEITALDSIDIAVIGEGEETVLEVVDSLYNRKENGFEIAKGIAYKKNGDICINAPREFISDLDQIPFPAWHLLPLHKYSVPATGANVTKQVFAIISSRGCPHNCIFCDSHTIFGRKFRGRSAQNMFDEIAYLNKTFNAEQFDFVDDTITINRHRVNEFCNLILSNSLKIKWMCNARVNTVNLEMLKLMRKAGCVRVEFGVESGDLEVLKRIKKGITVEQIKAAHKMAREAGMNIGSFVIVGNLGEDFLSIEKTKELLQEINTDDIYISIATPFPGTELYRIAKSNGWLRVHDWSKYVTAPTYLPEYRPIMETGKMKSEEIMRAFFYLHSRFARRKFQTRYGKAFFINPRFYQETLFKARSWKEIRHKIKLAKELISGYCHG